jgi:hypothetical protein
MGRRVIGTSGRVFITLITCAFAQHGQAALIASWNFNQYNGTDTALVADQGAGRMEFGGFLGDTVNYSGSTLNALEGVAAGQSLALRDMANNGRTLTIQVSGLGSSGFVLSYAGYRTSTGFTSHDWAYSTDGTSYTPFSIVTFSTPTVYEVKTLDFSGIRSLNNQAEVYFQVTLDGATSTSGNNRFDNLQITAVPEPAHWGLFAALALGAIAVTRQVRTSPEPAPR